MTKKTYYRQSAMRWKCFTHVHSRINSRSGHSVRLAIAFPRSGLRAETGRAGRYGRGGDGGGRRRWNDALKHKQEEAGVADGGVGARRGGVLEANRPEEDEPRNREQCTSARRRGD